MGNWRMYKLGRGVLIKPVLTHFKNITFHLLISIIECSVNRQRHPSKWCYVIKIGEMLIDGTYFLFDVFFMFLMKGWYVFFNLLIVQ